MIIGGLQKNSLLDYPGRISAIIFTQGCNFRCHFCYNPMLVWPIKAGKVNNNSSQAKGGEKDLSLISEDDLFHFLKKRSGKLDAVVITGGEPTIHEDLPEFIKKIKKLDYLVKLDTNGTNPKVIKKLISQKLINYLAMDIKAPAEKYSEVVGVNLDFENILKSVKIIMASGLPYEFRTTVAPGLLDKKDIQKIGKIIQGAQNWFLQKFKSDIDLVDSSYQNLDPYTSKEMAEIWEAVKKYVKNGGVR